MVIQSPFKDYYDFVAKQYGGGDPKIVYVRNRLAPPGETKTVELQGRFLADLDRAYYYRSDEPRYSRMYLILAGRAYLLERQIELYEFIDLNTEDVNRYRIKLIDPEEEKKAPWWRRRTSNRDLELEKEQPALVDLCRQIGEPVFVIGRVDSFADRKTRIKICGQCPILSQIGAPALFSPQQVYQDIAMFVGNRMKDPPDAAPPVEVSNRQKILKAGFDLVQSFRHRK